MTGASWNASRWVIGVYGICSFIYAALSFSIAAGVVSCTGLMLHVFGSLQTACNFITLYLHYLLASSWAGSGRTKLLISGALVAVAALQPFIVKCPHTARELCSWQFCSLHLTATAIWDAVLLLVTMVFLMRGICAKRRRTAAAVSLVASDHLDEEDPAQPPVGAARTLVLLQAVRLVMEAINVSGMAANGGRESDAFLPMFILVNIMEHGQSCFLLATVLLQGSFRPHLLQLFAVFRRCGIAVHEPVEAALPALTLADGVGGAGGRGPGGPMGTPWSERWPDTPANVGERLDGAGLSMPTVDQQI